MPEAFLSLEAFAFNFEEPDGSHVVGYAVTLQKPGGDLTKPSKTLAWFASYPGWVAMMGTSESKRFALSLIVLEAAGELNMAGAPGDADDLDKFKQAIRNSATWLKSWADAKPEHTAALQHIKYACMVAMAAGQESGTLRVDLPRSVEPPRILAAVAACHHSFHELIHRFDDDDEPRPLDLSDPSVN